MSLHFFFQKPKNKKKRKDCFNAFVQVLAVGAGEEGAGEGAGEGEEGVGDWSLLLVGVVFVEVLTAAAAAASFWWRARSTHCWSLARQSA